MSWNHNRGGSLMSKAGFLRAVTLWGRFVREEMDERRAERANV